MRHKNKLSGLKIALPGLLIFLLLGPVLLAGCGSSADLQFPTEYQAVFMDNGQVFFGKVKSSGPNYLTLRDVFYIQRQVDEKQKERRNILLKRGSEWHGPDYMVINVRHVVLIEPVAPDSRVAQLIRQAHSPMAPAPPPAPAKEKAPPAKEKPAPAKEKPAPAKDKKSQRR